MKYNKRLGVATAWKVINVQTGAPITRVTWIDDTTRRMHRYKTDHQDKILVDAVQKRAVAETLAARHIQFCRATKTVLVLL